MDTKMKLPELRVGIDQQSLSLSYVIRASGLGGMNDKQASEVISRCNAAPKLVEALRQLACLGNGDKPGNSEGNRIAQAILKETGAEK